MTHFLLSPLQPTEPTCQLESQIWDIKDWRYNKVSYYVKVLALTSVLGCVSTGPLQSVQFVLDTGQLLQPVVGR